MTNFVVFNLFSLALFYEGGEYFKVVVASFMFDCLVDCLIDFLSAIFWLIYGYFDRDHLNGIIATYSYLYQNRNIAGYDVVLDLSNASLFCYYHLFFLFGPAY